MSYELHSLRKGNVAVRVLRALGRLIGIDNKAEIVTLEYEHVGDKADEYGYLELDMSNTDPGYQLLTVKFWMRLQAAAQRRRYRLRFNKTVTK